MSRASASTAQVVLCSYASERADPQLVRLVFNCTNLRDPIGQPTFKGLDGRNIRVREWITVDPRVEAIKRESLVMIEMHLRAGEEKYLGIGYYDTHGKWIAPAVAEEVASGAEDLGYTVAVVHFELQSGGSND